MHGMDFYFSIKGRIGRRDFWQKFMLPIFLVGLSIAYGEHMMGQAMVEQKKILRIIVEILLAWPSIAVTAKRWHDRDKSGWFILINVIPIIGPLWAFIENGFLKGTTGDNKYGADPLAQQ